MPREPSLARLTAAGAVLTYGLGLAIFPLGPLSQSVSLDTALSDFPEKNDHVSLSTPLLRGVPVSAFPNG